MEETKFSFLEKAIGYIKTNWKKVAIIALAVVIAYNFFSCGNSEDNSNGIKPDQWYHNDLVNFQNCGIRNSKVKSSNSVYVEYIPVCKECHEWDDFFSIAYVTQDEQYLKTYTCDCGEQTTIKIAIY